MPIPAKTILVAMTIAAAASAPAHADDPFVVDLQIDAPVPGMPRIDGDLRIDLTPSCPDPAAAAIDASVVATAADNSWADVAVTGVVRNQGSAYASGANQQVATLSTSAGDSLGQANFPALAAGEAVNIASVIRVSSGDEFLPDVRLQITYDPDIFRDGNPANDDCRMGNNEAVLTAAELHSIALGG